MKAKSVLSAVLLLFVAVSVAYLVMSESRPQPESDRGGVNLQAPQTAVVNPESAPVADEGEHDDTGHKLVAYYFHRDARCRTCLTIEAYAKEAIEVAFPEALESGRLEWYAVNLDEPSNEHFAADYELTTSSLVLVDMEDDERNVWKTLYDVWDLVSDKMEFQAYVEAEARLFLENGS